MKLNDKYKNLKLNFNEDGSLAVYDAEDLILEISAEQLNITNPDEAFKIVSGSLNKSGFYVENVASISDALNQFNSYDKSDKNRRALVNNTPVNWTVMVKAKECQRIDSVDDDEAINKNVVSYKHPEHDPLINMGYVKGINDTESQPMGSSFITNRSAIHLDSPSPKDKEHREILLNDVYEGKPCLTRFTVGRSYALIGFKIKAGKTPVERGFVWRENSKGQPELVPTIRNVGDLFQVVDVTPVLNAHKAVTDFTVQNYTGLASSKVGGDFLRKAVQVFNEQSIKLMGKDISDVIAEIKDNPILFNQSAPICSLTALGGDEIKKYECLNREDDLLKFAEGMGSLETALQLLITSNTGSIDSALVELLVNGPKNRSKVDAKYGASILSSGIHSVKYVAAASDFSPNKWKTYSGMLAETEVIRRYIENNALSVSHDDYVSLFHKHIVNYEASIRELIDAITATTTRMASNNSEGVDVYMPDDIQLIVGVNPNEFIRGNITYGGSDNRVYFDFDFSLHYKLYTKHEAGSNAVIQWKQADNYYVYPPTLVSLMKSLVNNNFVDIYLYNKGITEIDKKDFTNLHDALIQDNDACLFSINQFNAFAFLLGAAVREAFDDIKSDKYTNGFNKLMGVHASVIEGQSITATLSQVINAIKDNRVSVDLCKPGHYKCNQRVLNKKSNKSYPICTVTYSDKLYLLLNPNRLTEHVESLTGYEISNDGLDKNMLKLNSIAQLESVMANSGGKLVFGPSDKLDDFTCLKTGGNVARNILMHYDDKNKKLEPVLFKISMDDLAKNRGRLTYSYMSYASESVNDMVEHDIEKLLFGEDNFINSDTCDGYVLIQSAPQLLKGGNMRLVETVATPVDCSYSLAPVRVFDHDSSEMTYDYARDEISETRSVNYTGQSSAKAPADYTKNIKFLPIIKLVGNLNIKSGSKDYITGNVNRSEGTLKYAAGTDVTKLLSESNFNDIVSAFISKVAAKSYDEAVADPIKVKVMAYDETNDTEAETDISFKVEFVTPSATVTYNGLDSYNASLSTYGYIRKPIISGLYYNLNGHSIKYDVECNFGTMLNNVWTPSDLNTWSSDVFTVEFVVPSYINKVNYREYYPVYTATEYVALDDEPQRPLENHKDIQETYDYKNVFKYYGYNSHSDAYLLGSTNTIKSIIELTNRPVVLAAIRDLNTNVSNVTAVTRSKIIDGKDIIIRLNGEFTTSQLNEYINDYVMKYKRNAPNIIIIPQLPLLNEDNSWSNKLAAIQWIGDKDYWKNPRINARSVQGDVVSVTYERLPTAIFDIQKDWRKDMIVLIKQFVKPDKVGQIDEEKVEEE